MSTVHVMYLGETTLQLADTPTIQSIAREWGHSRLNSESYAEIIEPYRITHIEDMLADLVDYPFGKTTLKRISYFDNGWKHHSAHNLRTPDSWYELEQRITAAQTDTALAFRLHFGNGRQTVIDFTREGNQFTAYHMIIRKNHAHEFKWIRSQPSENTAAYWQK